MVVFLNGAFGIGKTTVARLLRERTPGSALFDPELLVAPFAVVRARLEKRGLDSALDSGAWQLRRAAECCAAHGSPGFSEQIATEDASAADVAAAIAARLEEA